MIQRTIDVSRDFFQLPEEVKLQYAQEHQKVYPKTARGYVPIYGEVVEEGKGSDPKDVFDLGLERPVSDKPFTGPNFMPDESVVPGFATSHYQLQDAVISKAVPSLLKALGLILNFEDNWFEMYFDDPIVLQRVSLYPPKCSSIGKHKDNAIFTVLIQEHFSTPSLRIYTQGKWIDVPCIKDTLVINLGNLLQIWTNGLVVSTPHEVVHTLPTSRISIPFFISPKVGAIIEPRGTDRKVNSTSTKIRVLYYFNAVLRRLDRSRCLDIKPLCVETSECNTL